MTWALRLTLLAALMGGFLIGSVAVPVPPAGAATGDSSNAGEVQRKVADYVDTPNTVAIQRFLAKHHSPMPWWTIAAFAHGHPDFSIPGFLSVMWCESSLGTTGGSARYNNPGNIKYLRGSVAIWQTLATDTWFCPGQGVYNVYPDMRTGTRAAIRLIYEGKSGYNAKLAAKDFERFASIYYGQNVPGLAKYVDCLERAHALIVREAAHYGVQW